MKWPKWTITRAASGDFMPLVFGTIMLVVAFPAFIMLLVYPDENSNVVRIPLLIFLAIGTVFGASFLVLGIRVCTYPGSWAYKLSHGRFFWR